MILKLIDRRLRPDSLDSVTSRLEVLASLVAEIGQPFWSFDLVLVEDDAMTDLNGQFRGKDGVTDVLSFSYLLEDGPGECDLGAGLCGARHDLWIDPLATTESSSEETQIGEVILAPSFVESRCRQRQWSVENEFPLLVVHGALHLLGWDHQDEEETRSMRDLEAKFLARCDFSHPLQNEERLNG